MNANAFRHWYDYHFAINRQIWDTLIVPLPQDLFVQHQQYGVGSVRNQVVHMLEVDEAWFSGLRGLTAPEHLIPDDETDRASIRTVWDKVEAEMRAFLSTLTDDMLATRPLAEINPDDAMLPLWQILLHVVNHGTDHRAQLLRQLNALGVRTFPQDYIFYCYDHP